MNHAYAIKRHIDCLMLTLFAYAKIWLMLMLMLKCCERKTLFRG